MLVSPRTTRAVCSRLATTHFRPACSVLLRHPPAYGHTSTFTTTAVTHLPRSQAQPELKLKLESEYTITEPTWPHPVYTFEEMEQIVSRYPFPLRFSRLVGC